ncbi:MAG: D-isomer specific 2-hydroxyacid dehydrogenase NAD-binding protein [Deltaproteobacteria bacterium]|jgi:glyoxylate reductase|nr:D-isomer specific 2-hydroxyacid dehydrogenase NAD-binding protein [Deltaproteobacteria bacterium]
MKKGKEKEEMKPKVLVTRQVYERPLRLLQEKAEVTLNRENRSMTPEEIMAALPGKMGILAMGSDPMNAKVLEAGKDLKIVANNAVGFNNIDLDAATRLKIAATNTPDVLTDTTADLTFALILGVARRIAEADRFVRAGKWTGWTPSLMIGGDVHNKTLGVIGLGRIGSAVARRGQGFNMRIVYYDIRRLDPAIEQQHQLQFFPLRDLLQMSDFVTLHVPLTAETKHLIGAEELSLMKKTAYLINASRGPVVDEKALVEALRAGKIAGAGLDVFEAEPKVAPELLQMENAVLVPHIGSATDETREAMTRRAVNNLLAVIRGEVPPNILNPEVYRK